MVDNITSPNCYEKSRQVPMKWKKHLVLVKWKLRYMDDLENSIKRFSVKECENFIHSITEEQKKAKRGTTFIIKLVYPDVFYKLPNLIVRNKDDIERTQAILSEINLNNFCEIWYCKNFQGGMNSTVFGRLLISNNSTFPRCAIHYDLVWSASARVIEDYPNISVPFLSARRDNWNAQLQFENIISGDLNKDAMINQAIKVIQRASAYTPEIIDFANYVFSSGCSHLCLEFSMTNDCFQFIDWDSDNDAGIINRSS